MFGALIGDCIGSFWEMSGNKDPQIPLWMPASRFTDDSVCTSAIAHWLLNGKDSGESLHSIGQQYSDVGFAKKMRAWLKSEKPEPYGSWGNGSAMRVSPVALWAQEECELMMLAEQSAMPTHNHPEAIRGAQATAWAIQHAFEHRNPISLLEQVEQKFNYENLIGRSFHEERAGHLFDVSCKGTVPLAIIIAARSGSFDQTMIGCCSMGGDADTLGAIAGPIAEGLYGIPQQHLDNAKLRFSNASDLWKNIENLYAHPRAQANLAKWKRTEGTFLAQTDDRRIGPHRLKFK